MELHPTMDFSHRIYLYFKTVEASITNPQPIIGINKKKCGQDVQLLCFFFLFFFSFFLSFFLSFNSLWSYFWSVTCIYNRTIVYKSQNFLNPCPAEPGYTLPLQTV